MGKYPYIVAEIGGNHNGDIELGKKMIKAAKECGADAVKFQLYRREDLWTEDHLKELNDGVVKLENVSNWSTKELGLNNIFEQVDKFAVQEQEHIVIFLITLVNLVLIMVHLHLQRRMLTSVLIRNVQISRSHLVM